MTVRHQGVRWWFALLALVGCVVCVLCVVALSGAGHYFGLSLWAGIALVVVGRCFPSGGWASCTGWTTAGPRTASS